MVISDEEHEKHEEIVHTAKEQRRSDEGTTGKDPVQSELRTK